MEKNNKKVCKITYPDKYEQKYINGAFGGRTAKGEMVVNFFYETLPYPENSEIEFVNENAFSEQIGVPNEFSIKEVKAGIIMNLETAKSVYEWLGRNIKSEEDKDKNKE